METRTAQLEVWAAREGGRRRGRRVRGRRERDGSFILGSEVGGIEEICGGGDGE